MKGHCRDLWEQEISYLANKEDQGEPIDAFEAWHNGMRNHDQSLGDEFSRYCPRGSGTAPMGSGTLNSIAWWSKETEEGSMYTRPIP
jgi:hypothetical protein